MTRMRAVGGGGGGTPITTAVDYASLAAGTVEGEYGLAEDTGLLYRWSAVASRWLMPGMAPLAQVLDIDITETDGGINDVGTVTASVEADHLEIDDNGANFFRLRSGDLGIAESATLCLLDMQVVSTGAASNFNIYAGLNWGAGGCVMVAFMPVTPATAGHLTLLDGQSLAATEDITYGAAEGADATLRRTWYIWSRSGGVEIGTLQDGVQICVGMDSLTTDGNSIFGGVDNSLVISSGSAGEALVRLYAGEVYDT